MGCECRRAEATGAGKTNGDGRFELTSPETPGADVILYVTAKGGQALVSRGAGDNPAIALLSVLGNSPPSTVVINEMTTVASVWTNDQFIDGTAIKGPALGLKIAAGNVSSFVDFKQVGGARPFKIRLTAARRLQWPTSRRWRTCYPVVLRL